MEVENRIHDPREVPQRPAEICRACGSLVLGHCPPDTAPGRITALDRSASRVTEVLRWVWQMGKESKAVEANKDRVVAKASANELYIVTAPNKDLKPIPVKAAIDRAKRDKAEGLATKREDPADGLAKKVKRGRRTYSKKDLRDLKLKGGRDPVTIQMHKDFTASTGVRITVSEE